MAGPPRGRARHPAPASRRRLADRRHPAVGAGQMARPLPDRRLVPGGHGPAAVAQPPGPGRPAAPVDPLDRGQRRRGHGRSGPRHRPPGGAGAPGLVGRLHRVLGRHLDRRGGIRVPAQRTGAPARGGAGTRPSLRGDRSSLLARIRPRRRRPAALVLPLGRALAGGRGAATGGQLARRSGSRGQPDRALRRTAGSAAGGSPGSCPARRRPPRRSSRGVGCPAGVDRRWRSPGHPMVGSASGGGGSPGSGVLGGG